MRSYFNSLNPNDKFDTVFVFVGLGLIFSVATHFFTAPDERPYGSITGVHRDLAAHRIDKVSYYPETDELVVTRHHADPVLVPVPDAYAADLIGDLVDAGVDVTPHDGEPSRDVLTSVGRRHGMRPFDWLVGFGLSALCALLFARACRADAQRNARPATESTTGRNAPTTRFADVAGADEAVADLAEMVAYLRDPDSFTRLGAKPPRGALLVGPPGTGKTLLARAVAGEAGVAFHTATGSDFNEKYVGVGAKRIRNLFAKARASQNAVIFIDEIDAVARRRGDGDADSGRESDATLIALLAELDGFAARGNILVLAATNRPEVLDPALTRPGRLDRKIEVPTPDRRGRQAILGVHTTGKPLADDVDLAAIALRTPGFSGAQLEAVVNEACMVATRRGADAVAATDFAAAVATIAMGRARTSAVVTEHDARVTAWHEAGHTAAAFLLPDADDPVAVSIVPRGPAGGVTWMSGSDDMFLSRAKAHAQLTVALAGRAAEELLLDGEYTQGAHGDLTSATDLATRMVTQYGMSRLGYTIRSNASATDVVEVVEELLADAHRRATTLLAEHRAFVAAIAELLLAEKDISGAQVAELHAATHPTRLAAAAQPTPAVAAARVARPVDAARGLSKQRLRRPVPVPRRPVPAAALNLRVAGRKAAR